MKSNSCTNHTPGQGFSALASAEVPTATTQPAPQAPPHLQVQPTVAFAHKPPNTGTGSSSAFRYCAHLTAAGRHCRMLALVDSELCAHHNLARQKRLQKQPVADRPIADLLGSLPTFETPASVHHFIGDIVKQFTQKRISRPDALALGYLCQLLLTSFAGHRKWTSRR